MRTLVKGGRIVTNSQDYAGDVLIEGSRIAAVGDLGDVPADKVIDAKDRLVLPGGVDPHTHFDLPFMGTVSADDFYSGTVAAAAGGTTTVVDYAIQEHGQSFQDTVETWKRKATGKSVIDWSLHLMVTDLPDSSLPDLDKMIEEGITSFKFLMAYKGTLMTDDETIFKAMRRTAENHGLVMMHCENGLVIEVLQQEILARGGAQPIEHATTRPSIAEGEATNRAIALAEMAGVPVYIVHISAAEALDAVIRARRRGVAAYGETCPQYLCLTDEKLKQPDFEGAKFVCAPPIRPPGHDAALWAGLTNGGLQSTGTDHASFRFKDQKELGRNDFRKIPYGLPGVEWRIGLLHHFGVRQGRLSLNRFVELISTNAAKLFGLYPRKGEIAPGSDADILIFNPNTEVTISSSTMATDSDYTPYEGVRVRGWAESVLLRGSVIVDKAKFVGEAGQGEFQRCEESAAWGPSLLS